jgi:alcohol dehydrogenase YqhD (iron-dependent ADH family)
MDRASARYPEKFARMAVNVFGVRPDGKSAAELAKEGIAALREFWKSIGAPTRLADYGIDDSKIGEMAQKATAFGPIGRYITLQAEDVEDIYRSAL